MGLALVFYSNMGVSKCKICRDRETQEIKFYVKSIALTRTYVYVYYQNVYVFLQMIMIGHLHNYLEIAYQGTRLYQRGAKIVRSINRR